LNDRLFRVHVHQPFTSTSKIIKSQCDDSKSPTVKHSASLGDICIFLLAIPIEKTNCESWAAGKITQFAFYKQKSKRDQQYKKSEASVESSVGVSCSWFKQYGNKFSELSRKSPDYLSLFQSYICTLSLGCTKDVLSTDIKSSSLRQVPLMSALYIASDFYLEHNILQFI